MQCPPGFSRSSLRWLVWKLLSQDRLHVFFKTLLCLCQLLQKHQARSWERCGWMVAGVWIIKCFVRNTDTVLTVFPCRSANCSATKWQFRRRMLFYRGDKLQVSFVALGERFTAAFQLDEWEPEFWLTAAPDRAQSLRSAAVTSSLPMKMSVCPECPTHSAFSGNDDESLENMFNLPFFFLPISLFSDVMTDVESPSRTATHTRPLPGIYRVTGTCVYHFSLIMSCCLSTLFCLCPSLNI